MTDPSPGTGSGPAMPCRVRSEPEHSSRARGRFDRARLHDGIACRRAQLAELEASMVAACENAAARAAARSVRIDDRATWDRATWDRYLAEAARLEPDYMPAMLRLLGEISRLECLIMISDVTQAA